MSAIISACGLYRWRLERTVAECGKTFGFFGINPSTADAEKDDQTVKKWIGFTQRNGGSRFIVGNVFAYRSTDVKALATVADPFGADWGLHIAEIIQTSDVLVPCWGSASKLPKNLRPLLDQFADYLRASGKPLLCFGQNDDGTPTHPQMLGYHTELRPFE